MLQESEIKNVIESALFSFGKPLEITAIFNLFDEDDGVDKNAIRKAIESLEEDCVARGIELKKVGSGYRYQAKQDYAKWLQSLWEEKPPRYSRALLETMVLIAYKQPITRGEIEDVRGVSVSSHIVKTLQERDWIRVVGHRDVPGKPALFATTKGFLDYFNLSSLEQLPSLAQIRDLDKINEELEFSENEKNNTELNTGDITVDEDVAGSGEKLEDHVEEINQDDSSPTEESLLASSEDALTINPEELSVIEEFFDQTHDSETTPEVNEDSALQQQSLQQTDNEKEMESEQEPQTTAFDSADEFAKDAQTSTSINEHDRETEYAGAKHDGSEKKTRAPVDSVD